MKFFSSVHLDKTGTLKGLQKSIDVALENGAKSLLIFVSSEHEFDLDELPPLFSSLPIPAYAGVFPGVIHDFRHYNKGALVCGIAVPLISTVIEEITRPYIEINKEIEQWLNGSEPAGAFVFIDGQGKGIDNLVSCLYDCLGPTPTVLGGGAGYLDFVHRTCIITAEKCYKNSALITNIPASFTLQVRHGWEDIAGPFLVTGAKDNVLQSINFEPALSFYKEIIRENCKEPVNFDNFMEVSKSYPLGMAQLDNEFLVRDPIQIHGESIECAGSIPDNSMVYILNSQPEKLIQSARKAAKDLRANLSSVYENDEGYYTFTIDCISRQLFLGEDYPKELEAIKDELPDNTSTIGILSIGEIASSSQGVIRFLNKTTLIGGISR